MKTKKALAASNTGKITLTVATFKNNAAAFPSGPFCTLLNPGGVTITDPAGNGSSKKPFQVGLDPNDPMAIWVQSKNATGGQAGPVDLEFTIASSDPNSTYTATGVFQFIQTKASSVQGPQDPVGGVNFKKSTASAGLLKLKNFRQHYGNVMPPQTCPRWELYIQIQDQNGLLGWIDPGVENSDDM